MPEDGLDYEGGDWNEESMGGNFDDFDEGDMDDGDRNSANFKQMRNKRRSKNDNVGRTFICGCGKSYLSYPALYTHIKQKHLGAPPPGTNSQQYHTGRGRGRPRKEKPENNMVNVFIDEKFDSK